MKLRSVLFLLAALTACQNPQSPAPAPAPAPRLYAAGGQFGVPEYAVVWTGDERTNVGSGEILAFAKQGSDLYAAGYSNDTAGYWRNGTWHDISPSGSQSSGVTALALTGDVWMVGYSVGSDDLEKAVLWKNGTPQVLSALADNESFATSVAVNGSDVYVGGHADNASSVAVPGYWKNGVWTSLPTSAAGKRGSVLALTVVGSHLYAAGYREDASTSQLLIPGYWKDGVWNPLSVADPTKNSMLNSFLVTDKGDIYAAGWRQGAAGGSQPGYWKNGVWTALSQLNAAASSGATSLILVGTDLYVGGYNSNAAQQWQAGYWKNGFWTALSEDGAPHVVNALFWG